MCPTIMQIQQEGSKKSNILDFLNYQPAFQKKEKFMNPELISRFLPEILFSTYRKQMKKDVEGS